jgi:hypothetical protein
MSNQPFFGIDTLVDSEDLMSWLLLNPEVDFEIPSNQWNYDISQSSTGLPNSFEFKPFDEVIPISNVGTEVPVMHEIRIPKIEPVSSVTSPSDYTSSNGHATIKDSATKVARKAVKTTKKRSRESVEDLESRVNELKAENADLHAHLLNVTQRTTEVHKQRVSMERLMAVKLAELGDRSDTDQSELAAIVKQYTDIYADYGKCRQREIAFHLQQLEKLIVPTKTTKMCLWTLQQDKSFYQRHKSPMYDMLAKELEIAPEQTEKIQERRYYCGVPSCIGGSDVVFFCLN